MLYPLEKYFSFVQDDLAILNSNFQFPENFVQIMSGLKVFREINIMVERLGFYYYENDSALQISFSRFEVAAELN